MAVSQNGRRVFTSQLLVNGHPANARDGLIKKGLVYSSERGTVAFTVPHFGKFLRAQKA